MISLNKCCFSTGYLGSTHRQLDERSSWRSRVTENGDGDLGVLSTGLGALS